MFTELEKKKIPLSFGDTELWLRYDNAAFLKIEKSGYDPFDIRAIGEDGKAARIFLDAGLDCCISELKIENRRADIINALLTGDDTLTVALTVETAILYALPAPSISKKQSGGLGDLFTLFVDVMHNDEAVFWSSTMREIVDRCDRYSIFKGWKNAPLQIKKYDDE